jgi:ESCRT-II complex subunit VPS25
MKEKFVYPEFYSFPPFFTIQKVEATRRKQLSLWRELILKYHTDLKIRTLVVHDCPLWKNDSIDRSLNPNEIAIVMNDFVKSGHGEWENEALKTRCRVLWRKPEQLASDIYDWAVRNGYVNSVCTLYELHSGDDINGMSFQGADEELMRRALSLLETQGKCILFRGETTEGDGIKFL